MQRRKREERDVTHTRSETRRSAPSVSAQNQNEWRSTGRGGGKELEDRTWSWAEWREEM